MNKEATAAQKLLKALKYGHGPVLALGAGTAAGYGGYRYGAKKTADAMTSSFIDANARENQQIRDSFRDFNRMENRQLMNAALRKGILMGAAMQASQMKKTSSLNTNGNDMDKIAFIQEIYNDAYNNEIEKLNSLASMAGKAYGKVHGTAEGLVGKSFKNLGSGIKSQAQQAKFLFSKGSKGNRRSVLKGMGTSALETAKKSKRALAVTGVGTVGAGYAISR